MKPDDDVCLCFHVTKRKLQNFVRIEKPRRVGQMSECFGAGTGCGWCRPVLAAMFEQGTDTVLSDSQRGSHDGVCSLGLKDIDELNPEQYAEFRAKYVKSGRGTPPPESAT